jgi:hypothetical protein
MKTIPKTIEVIDIVNHGNSYSDEKVVKFYYPANVFMVGKIPHFKKDALIVLSEYKTQLRHKSRVGIFYPTTRKKLYDCVGKFVIEVVPVPCLAMLHDEEQPLHAGFDNWHGTGTGPHNRPTVCFSVRLLDEVFTLPMNKTQCAGEAKKTPQGRYYWEEDCSNPAIQSQYFHVNGQIQRRVAVCNDCLSDADGFGKYRPK